MTRLASLDRSLRQRVIFIHMNHTNPLLDADSEARANVARLGFRVAERGMRLEL